MFVVANSLELDIAMMSISFLSSEAIILSDDLLLSSYTAGWVGLYLIHMFGLKAFVPENSYISLERSM